MGLLLGELNRAPERLPTAPLSIFPLSCRFQEDCLIPKENLIIPEGGFNDAAIDLITGKIRSVMPGNETPRLQG
jgi:hypothetical protein